MTNDSKAVEAGDVTDSGECAVSEPVWLVVIDRGGLFGVYHDRDRADEAARSISGILVQLPVVADYRNPVADSTDEHMLEGS